MLFTWIHRIARWSPVLIFALSTPVFALDTIDWTAQARLRDGRTIPLRFEASNSAPSFYTAYQKSKLTQFKLSFQHPDTQETIVWQGARYFSPVLIDFVAGVPYLVIYGRPTQDTAGAYGCPELPYVYLRHGATGWQAIPVEQAPAELATANLSVHEMPADAAGRHFSSNDVDSRLAATERQTSGQLQRTIPRKVADWNTDQKRSALQDRMVGDCRPPRPPLQTLALPNPTESTWSILEVSDYVPEKAYDAADWNDLVADPQRADQCKPLFKRIEVENFTQDLRFTQDPTTSKRVPYSRNGGFDAGIQILCDTHVWFIQPQDSANKVTITQFTRAGDLVFRATYTRPVGAAGPAGTLRLSSLRAEAGTLYADWVQARPVGNQWLVKRVLKMRAALP